MNQAINDLLERLSEYEGTNSALIPNDMYYLIALNAISNIDTSFYYNIYSKDQIFDMKRYEYGWISLLKNGINYTTDEIKPVVFKASDEFHKSTLRILNNYNLINKVKSYIELAKYNLLKLSKEENDYLFTFTNKVEYEKIDRDAYKLALSSSMDWMQKRISSKEYKKVSKLISRSLEIPSGLFISYSSPVEVDEYYHDIALDYIQAQFLHAEFGDNDRFGDFYYRDFKNLLYHMYVGSLRHMDYCREAIIKNSRVKIQNIISHSCTIQSLCDSLKTIEGYSLEKSQKILSYITLNKENHNLHNLIGSPLPPYISFGKNQITRSVYGSLNGGLNFLFKEIKRKNTADYFTALNLRESRFRNDIHHFFNRDNIIYSKKQIIINRREWKTDIDAVLYDKNSGTLGIFQLKWQDIYLNSTKERNSRLINLSTGVKTWVTKMQKYKTEISSKKSTEVFSELQLDLQEKSEIKQVLIFVIGRNSMHFTNSDHITNEAAFGTWYQLMTMYYSIKNSSADILSSIYWSLIFTRKSYEKLSPPPEIDDDLVIGNTSIRFKVEN